MTIVFSLIVRVFSVNPVLFYCYFSVFHAIIFRARCGIMIPARASKVSYRRSKHSNKRMCFSAVAAPWSKSTNRNKVKRNSKATQTQPKVQMLYDGFNRDTIETILFRVRASTSLPQVRSGQIRSF